MYSSPSLPSLLVPCLVLFHYMSPALALTCYSITAPAQAPNVADCDYILDRLPALKFDPDAQGKGPAGTNLTITKPRPGVWDNNPRQFRAFKLPAHFRHGRCGIAVRANVPGGGPNPPQRGAILPAGGSVVGDTCIPVRFVGGTLTAFWSVAQGAGRDLVRECVSNNQQGGFEWGSFLPRQGPPYPNAYSGEFDSSNSSEAGPSNWDNPGPSNYGAGASGEAGPSNYQNASSLYSRGLGGSLRPGEAAGTLEPRGGTHSTQGGAVEALYGLWLAGHDMPRDSLANIYDI